MTVSVSPRVQPRGFYRLLGVRLSSQLTDGLYQAALGTALAFNPERQATPLAVAGAFAVLLLPYSLVGPYAGALLDRWDRRRVFMVANAARAALLVLLAALIGLGAPTAAILVLALGIGGVTRFISAGYSAALPHTVGRRDLVAMNALNTTLGAAATGVGVGVALGVRTMVGNGNAGATTTLALAVSMALICASIAAGFRPRALGPHEHADRTSLVIAGLRDGFAAVRHSHPVASSMSALASHRVVFGLNTLLLLLLSRHHFSGNNSDGLASFAAVGTATAVGLFAAAGLTPLLTRRFGRPRVVLGAVATCAVANIFLMTFSLPVLIVVGGILGLSGQVIKLSTDATMQLNIPDDRRGHVFAFQDALFNICFVAAVTVAALLAPSDGVSYALVIAGSCLYALGGVAAVVIARHAVSHHQHAL